MRSNFPYETWTFSHCFFTILPSSFIGCPPQIQRLRKNVKPTFYKKTIALILRMVWGYKFVLEPARILWVVGTVAFAKNTKHVYNTSFLWNFVHCTRNLFSCKWNPNIVVPSPVSIPFNYPQLTILLCFPQLSMLPFHLIFFYYLPVTLITISPSPLPFTRHTHPASHTRTHTYRPPLPGSSPSTVVHSPPSPTHFHLPTPAAVSTNLP